MSPFTLPNQADAGWDDQAEPDKVDFDILAAGSATTGVISGCAVTAQGTPNMTVAVASGVIAFEGDIANVTGANVTIEAAHATLPRFDLILINKSGTLVNPTAGNGKGTAAAEPVFPAVPADHLVAAVVYIPALDTAIGATQIVDKRVPVSVTRSYHDYKEEPSAPAAPAADHVRTYGLAGVGAETDLWAKQPGGGTKRIAYRPTRIDVPASRFAYGVGSPTEQAAGAWGNMVHTWSLPDSVSSGVVADLIALPDDWDAGTIAASLIFFVPAGAGNQRLELGGKVVSLGEDPLAAADFTEYRVVGVSGVLSKATFTSLLTITVDTEYLRYTVARTGEHALDTSTTTCQLAGLLLEFTPS